MPLQQGTSSGVRSSNIKKLITEGYPKVQAIAISYSEAGEPSKKPSKQKKPVTPTE